MSDRIRNFLSRYGGPFTAADAAMVAPDFELKKTQFKEFYATQYPVLRAAEKTFRQLIELLVDRLDIDPPKGAYAFDIPSA